MGRGAQRVESSEGGLCLVHGRGTRMIEFLMQGVALGALYALIAIPLSLVWMTAHSLDLAVGGYAVFGGLAYAAAGGGGIGLLVALVAGAACELADKNPGVEIVATT